MRRGGRHKPLVYSDTNVYEAFQARIARVFAEFDHIIVAFSGGKDSGLLLNLCIRYMREHHITRKIAVFHQDFEAQYTATTDYVTHMMTSNPDLIEPYWSCVPMSVNCATSMYESFWVPWHPDKRDLWVRQRPDELGYPGVCTLENHPFDFYEFAMPQEDLYRAFTPWYHRAHGGMGRTICLVGIRMDESLNRWRAITAEKATAYDGLPWTTAAAPDVYSGYPLYDWTVEDIWVANARFDFPYNRLYDLFYQAGVPLGMMRVASPFGDWANNGGLNLYRVIEPDTWGRVVGRVNGANFTAMYGNTNAVAWRDIKLPPGHTWRSFVAFLLTTLPAETRAMYEQKFATSIEFWAKRGGVLSAETISELQAMGIPLRVRGQTNYATDKQAVIFDEYPDDWDGSEFALVPSYKRMAVCILKNDHLCKYMGFSQTKAEQERRRAAMEKYRDL